MRGFSRLLASTLLLCPTFAEATQFPDGRPVEMTVMFGAGSAADVTARYLADGMGRELGASIPVVNRTGGGGAAGYTYVANQPPDGYAVVWNSNSIVTNYYSGALPFNHAAFSPVARVGVETPAIAVRADAPWKTFKELVAHIQSGGSPIRVSNSGSGSHTHLAAAILFKVVGANVIHVPFSGGQAVTNLLGARIDATIQLPAALTPHVSAGSLRILAVLGAERDPVFPEAPTVQELGHPVDLEMWRGIAVPKGTPPETVKRLEDAIKRTVEGPSFQEAGRKLGFRPAFLPSREFDALINRDDAQLGGLMRELGLAKR